MKNALKIHYPCPSPESEFKNRFLSLLRGDESANLQNFIYSSPVSPSDPVRGAEFLEKIYQTCPEYYPYKSDQLLIASCAGKISDLIGENATFIDFGPGPGKSFRIKTQPILEKLKNVKTYIPIDLCHAYLEECCELAKNICPNIRLEPIHDSYYETAANFSLHSNPVIFFAGSTLFNCPGEHKEDFDIELKSRLELIRKKLGKNGYLIISHDANQDRESLITAYENKANADFFLNLLWRIKRDLAPHNFDPKNFDYIVEWMPENSRLVIGFNPTCDHHIVLDGEIFEFQKNKPLYIFNSLKYTKEQFAKIAKMAGFHLVSAFSIPGNPMAIHVFKV